jgi:hypothetical protein
LIAPNRRATFPDLPNLETRIALSTEDHAKADRRTLTDLSGTSTQFGLRHLLVPTANTTSGRLRETTLPAPTTVRDPIVALGRNLALIQERGALAQAPDSQQSVVPEPGEIPQAFSKTSKGYCSNHRSGCQLRRNHGLSEIRTLAAVTAASRVAPLQSIPPFRAK